MVIKYENYNDMNNKKLHLAKVLSGVVMFILIMIIGSSAFADDHSHVWVTQFNTVYHYKMCNICGTTTDVVAHSFPASSSYWSGGSASNCSNTNHHYFICSCGYSYIDDTGRAAHNPEPVTRDAAWNYCHDARCLTCHEVAIEGRCFKNATDAANNNPIQCNNLGTCYICGGTYDVAYHRVNPQSRGDRCIYCDQRILNFDNISFTVRNDSATQKYVEVKFKTMNSQDTIVSTPPHIYDPENYGVIPADTPNRVTLNYTISNKNVTLYGYYTLKDPSQLHLEEKFSRNVYAHFSLKNGGRTIVEIPAHLYGQYFTNDITAPTIASCDVQRTDIVDGWSRNVNVVISGTENYCGSVILSVTDLSTGQPVSFGGSYEARINVANQSWSYQFVPNINVNSEGKYIQLSLRDPIGNITYYNVYLSKIDIMPPTVTTTNITYGQVIYATLTDSLSFVNGYQITTTAVAPSTWTPIGPTSSTTVSFPGYNAGTYYIWAIDRAGNVGYAPVIVYKANGTGSVSMSGWTYGGTPSSPVPYSATNGTSNVSYSYSGRAGTSYGPTATRPVNGGSYTVTATFAATTNYNACTASVNFTISRAAGTGSVSMANYTYGDSPSNPVPSSATNGTSNVSYSYSGRGSTSYGPATSKPSIPGTYTVTATFGITQNYNACSATANFSVLKRNVTITAVNQTTNYPTRITKTTAKVTANNLLSGHSITAITLTETPSTTTFPTPNENGYGIGTITPSAATINNATITSYYNITYANGTWRVNDNTKPQGYLRANNPTILKDGRMAYNTRNISLTMKATDDYAGVKEVYLFNENSIPSSVASISSWKNWATSTELTNAGTNLKKINWTLSNGDGTKTVYLYIRDKYGNVSVTF